MGSAGGGLRVLGRFSWDRRRGRGRRGAGGLEDGRVGRGRVVIMCDSEGGVEAFLEAELVLEFFLGALLTNEFLGVRVVPPREADFGGGPEGLRAEVRRRKYWELGL